MTTINTTEEWKARHAQITEPGAVTSIDSPSYSRAHVYTAEAIAAAGYGDQITAVCGQAKTTRGEAVHAGRAYSAGPNTCAKCASRVAR